MHHLPATAAALASLLLVTACDRAPPQASATSTADAPPTPTAPAPEPLPVAISSPTASFLPPAERLILSQWRKAENRAHCAPLHFRDTAGAKGTPRAARFSGGWAIAWDQPGRRSAFGLAGVALLPDDNAPAKDHRARLTGQWPMMRGLQRLPQPAFAGYGLEGAAPYLAENPEGYGLNSLAYVRVGGQTCTYNVWSRLGRAHLEALLENLTLLDTG
ncbi:hypothetical protein [Novosphingobium sp.]|uniref:hypothetical protein n=1 Tax=Novosphingobium sp. TaxID=1874826 RepID=UPI0038B6DE8E